MHMAFIYAGKILKIILCKEIQVLKINLEGES